jgi:hypothetical protein
MSVQTGPESDSALSRLCPSTAAADQAGQSKHPLYYVHLRIKSTGPSTRTMRQVLALALAIYQTLITLASAK